MQSSLTSFATGTDGPTIIAKPLTKKGRTLHLYSPEDIEAHTPCSILHNFLPTDVADALLQELLGELPTFRRDKFQIFDRSVVSPHTVRLYVDDVKTQAQYTYNGGPIDNIGRTTEHLLTVSDLVRVKVNEEIERRTKNFQPNGERLKFQSPDEWRPNASFVNCYSSGKENVGWHSDNLTYLGVGAIIGSLSLGVKREFRVRKSLPQSDTSSTEQGQIAIHLRKCTPERAAPRLVEISEALANRWTKAHNSLLVMHANMQEEWKHSIAPAKAIDPHPVAGNRRFNITYRCYKDYLHPSLTPRCKCNMAAVLRCVQKRAATRGRYMWMCHTGFSVGGTSCGWFTWAKFDDEGKPEW